MIDSKTFKEQEKKTLDKLRKAGFTRDPNALIGSNIYVSITDMDCGGFLATITSLSRSHIGFLLHVSQTSVMGLGDVVYLIYFDDEWFITTSKSALEGNKILSSKCTVSSKWPS